MYSPRRGEIKYLSFKMVAMSRHKAIGLIVERARIEYLSAIKFMAGSPETIAPPCVNCPAHAIYYCGHFSVECRSFVDYCEYKCVQNEKKIPMVGEIVRPGEISKMVGLHESAIRRMEAAGKFPRRRDRIGWIKTDIEKWLLNRSITAKGK